MAASLSIESPLWRQSPPLVAAVSRANEYINLPEFRTNVLTALIKQCFLANCGQENFDFFPFESAIAEEAKKMIKDTDVTLVVGDTQGDSMTQCAAAGGSIFVSGGWLAQVQRLHERINHQDKQYKIQMAMLILKIIHEIIHTFTHKIMKFENKLRKLASTRDTAILTTEYIRTPITVGFKFGSDGSRNMGDMGFGGEEILSQIGVRFHFDEKTMASKAPFDFADFSLVKFNTATRKFVKFKSMGNLDEFLSAVTASTHPSLDDFRVELYAVPKAIPKVQAKKVAAAGKKRSAIDAGLDAAEDGTETDAVKIAASFHRVESEDDDEEDEDFMICNKNMIRRRFTEEHGYVDDCSSDEEDKRKN